MGHLRFLIFVPLTLFWVSQSAADQGMPNTPLIAQADAAWARRDELASLQSALSLYQQAVAQTGSKAQKRVLLERVSQGTFLLADDFIADGSDQKRATYKRAAQLGELCLRLEPGYAAKAKSSMKDAIAKLDKSYAGCMFFKAAGESRVSQIKGILSSLSTKPMIDELMKRVYKVDPQYLYGAPDRYYGAYYSVLPGFLGGSEAKSREHFQSALKIAPNFLGTKVLMAENLYKKGSPEYKQILTEIVKANPDDAPPTYAPENRIKQRKARQMLQAVGGVS